MKYAVIADLHANEEALRNVLEDASAQGAEKVVCLGDTVGYGPQPAETVALLRAVGAEAVAGNHDDAVAGRLDPADFIDIAEDAVRRHREQLSRDALEWLRGLPYTLETGGFVAAHGDFTAPQAFNYTETAEDAVANFRATSAQLLFVGHTHTPALFVIGSSERAYSVPPQDFTVESWKRYIVNPGSVGYPREVDGKCLSTYVLYDSTAHTVEFRSLPFPVSSLLQRGRMMTRRRKVLLACAALAAMAAVALATFCVSPRTIAQEEDPVDARTVVLTPGTTRFTPNLRLAKGSPAALLRVRYLDAADGEIECLTFTVKSSLAKKIKPPPQAAAAIISVFENKTGQAPEIKSFEPAALP